MADGLLAGGLGADGTERDGEFDEMAVASPMSVIPLWFTHLQTSPQNPQDPKTLSTPDNILATMKHSDECSHRRS